MYISYALLLLLASSVATYASSVSKLDCPDVIETEAPENLKDLFIGVWYEVFIWLDIRKAKLDCFSFEILETTPEEVEAVKEGCEGSGVSFDWDNVNMKIVPDYNPDEPGRLISNVPGEPEAYILQTCDFVTEIHIRQVSGHDEVAVAVSEFGAELLTRREPDREELDCLIHGIDVAQHYTWGIETCGRRDAKKADITKSNTKYYGIGY